MTFEEIKNLKIFDKVFVIDTDSKVYPKKVTGVKFSGAEKLNITCVDYTDKNYFNEYILPCEEVFLKESDALEIILHVKKSQIVSIKSAVEILQKRLREVLKINKSKYTENNRRQHD